MMSTLTDVQSDSTSFRWKSIVGGWLFDVFFFAGFLLEGHVTPVAMGNPPFEDVFPIEHGDIRLLC